MFGLNFEESSDKTEEDFYVKELDRPQGFANP